jgi:hypothetical protein
MNFNKYKTFFLIFFFKKINLFKLISYFLILLLRFLKKKFLDELYKFFYSLMKFSYIILVYSIFYFKFYYTLCLTKIIFKNFPAINFSIFPFSFINKITFPFFYFFKHIFNFFGLNRLPYFNLISESLSLKFFYYLLNLIEIILSLINLFIKLYIF